MRNDYWIYGSSGLTVEDTLWKTQLSMSRNVTIIDITQELIDEKVEFTTSERSVKQWLDEMYPLTVQLRENATKLSQQAVDILQHRQVNFAVGENLIRETSNHNSN